jgi:hypothetical protein
LSEREIESGIFTALTVADNVGKRVISGHFNRERQVDKPGRPTAPEGYDIGGVSGGPLMTMVDSANLCYWRLGGVMTEFSTSFRNLLCDASGLHTFKRKSPESRDLAPDDVPQPTL